MRPGVNGTTTDCPASFAAFSTAAPPASTIRSASEIFRPLSAAPLNSARMPSSVFSTCASCSGWLTAQSFCGARRMRAPLAPPRLSEPRKVEAEAQAVETSCGHGEARRQHLRLQRLDVLRFDQRVIDLRDRVLPDELFGRHLGAEVAGARTHVAVRELEPGAREGVGELVRVLHEATRDLFVDRVHAQRQVGGQHRRHQLLRGVEGVRDGRTGALGHPLLRAGRALGQLPLVAEQVLRRSCCSTSSAWSST